MKRIVLTFGLISGAIFAVMMAVSSMFIEEIGFDRGEMLGYATMVAAFLLVYFGVRSYRDTVGGGTITFGRAFGVGLLIVAVSSVCYVAAWQAVYYWIAPDFGDQYAAHLIAQARAAGESAEQLAAKVRELEHYRELYKNPLVNVAFTFLEPLPIGLAASLLSAALLRRAPAPRASSVTIGSTSPAL